MAKVIGSVDISQADKDVLDAFLADVNAARVEAGEAEFATIDDYATFVLASALQSYIGGKRRKTKEVVGDLYDGADQGTRDTIDTLLGR